MKKNILFVMFLSFVFMTNAQKTLWKKTAVQKDNVKNSKQEIPISFVYKLQVNQLKERLADAPIRSKSTLQAGILINLPDVNGEMQTYKLLEVPNFSTALSNKFPSIKSYQGRSIKNPSTIVSLAISKRGVKAIILASGKTSLIEPITENGDLYAVYDAKYESANNGVKCLMEDTEIPGKLAGRTFDTDDMTLRNFRLAVATDAEYSNNFDDNAEDVLAGINELLSYINPIYERDLSIHLNLIDNNEDVIYFDAASDPFSEENLNTQVQSTLTDVIGEENYDVGIVFSGQIGGGNSGFLACVCQDSQKGSAYAGSLGLGADTYVFAMEAAHEMGHQFGANHTFSRSEFTNANREPGSGTTIMSYAGVTGPYDIQESQDAQFLHYSIQQISNYIQSTSCATTTDLTNNAPTVDAGQAYTIPKGTAFKLTATGNDVDGDALTYSWEEADSNNANFDGFSVYYFPNPTSSGEEILPSFRAYLPTTSPTRYFPPLEEVLEGSLYNTWNMTSNVEKTMNFVAEVRDNSESGGQTASDDTQIHVTDNAGPFRVTSINNFQRFDNGETHTLTWDVANTDQAPVNESNVTILISSDGGQNFETLIENTPNDGEETITMPNEDVEKAYIIVEASDSVFYAASPAFSVGSGELSLECNTYENTTPETIPSVQGDYGIMSINVPNIGNIEDVNVNVDVDFTNVGNLSMVLIGPDGENHYIYLENCQGNSLNTTFDQEGESLPLNCGDLEGRNVEPIRTDFSEAFYGKPANGFWSLAVVNDQGGGNGSINSFSLEFCSETSTTFSNNSYSVNENAIEMYPNPTNGIVHFSYKSTEATASNIRVYDVSGKEAYHGNGDLNQMQLDLSFLQSGMYFVKINNGNQSLL